MLLLGGSRGITAGGQTVSGSGSSTGSMELKGEVREETSVEITVKENSEKGGVLEGVSISSGGKEIVKTGASGKAQLKGIPELTYELTFQKTGYQKKTIQCTFPKTGSEEKTVLLSKDSSGGDGGGIIIPTPTPDPDNPDHPDNPDDPDDPNDSGNTATDGENTDHDGNTSEEDGSSGESGNKGENGSSSGNSSGNGKFEKPTVDLGDNELPEGVPELTPEEMIGVDPEEGENHVILDAETVRTSVEKQSGLKLNLSDEKGKKKPIGISAFREEEYRRIKRNTIKISYKEGIVIRVPYEEEGLVADGWIPHNLRALSKEKRMPVTVLFEQGEETKGRVVFDPEFFDRSVHDRLEVGVQYDGSHVDIVLEKCTDCREEDELLVPQEAFHKVSDEGLGLRVRIYNPQVEEDLWYEWKFEPEDLKMMTQEDIDLFITPNPEAEDRVWKQTKGKKAQILTFSHHGSLPGKAVLRVKNMAGFRQGDTVNFLYSNPESGALDTMKENVVQDGDGFYLIELEHCSSYVLMREGSVLWLWIIIGFITMLVILLLFVLSRRERKRKELTEYTEGTNKRDGRDNGETEQ